MCNTCLQVCIDAIEFPSTYPVNRRYRVSNQKEFVAPRLGHFLSLPPAQQEALCQPSISHVENIKRVATAINENSKLASAIADYGSDILSSLITDERGEPGTGIVKEDAIVRSTLRQLYRDFSADGSRERDLCHKTIMQDMAHAFAEGPLVQRNRVLVPGAGLLRLPLILQLAGYEVEANEVSHHQLLGSLSMLNHAEDDLKYTLYPWALSFSNHVFRGDQFATVLIPDIQAKTLMARCARPSTLTINMNDFVTEYSKPCYKSSFDAVTTLFFIDTAPNLLDYITTVRHCLKPGGVWINVGPLLWNCYENGPAGRQEGDTDDDISEKIRHHFDSSDMMGSRPQMLEFSNDEVMALLEIFGFIVEVQNTDIGEAGFVANPRSMLQNMYRLSHWVARKGS
jgi:carnosine N-methyltransferase